LCSVPAIALCEIEKARKKVINKIKKFFFIINLPKEALQNLNLLPF
jgi:hypothetical protein